MARTTRTVKAGDARDVVAFLGALAGAFLIAFLALRPPPERGGGPQDFSLPAAMGHIHVIAAQPHVTGTPAIAETRAYLIGELRALGMAVEARPFPLPEAVQGRLGAWGARAAEGVNIVASLPGSNPALPPILLMAHYDTVPGSPGAADDSAGVAVALETARAMRGRNRHDLIVLLTDAEEPGLAGSRAFFAGGEAIGAVINLEARGGGGRVALFETAPGQAVLTRRFAAGAGNVTAHSFAMLVYRYLPNDTDFSAAKDTGLPGFNLAFIGDPGLYHSPLATADRVDQTSVRHMGYVALDAVRALDRTGGFASGGPEPVFSDIFGLAMIIYAAPVGWIPIFIAGLALLAIAVITGRRGDLSPGGVAAALGSGVVLMPLAGAGLFGVSLLTGGLGYYEALAQTGWLEIQALLLGLAVLLLLPARFIGLWSGWLAFLALGLGLAVATQVLAPQAGPLVAWPVMTTAVAALLFAALGPPVGRAAAMVVLIVVTGFVLYWAHLLFVGAGQGLPSAMALFVFLAPISLWPWLARLPRRRIVAGVALVLMLASAGVALKMRTDPPPASVPTYEN